MTEPSTTPDLTPEDVEQLRSYVKAPATDTLVGQVLVEAGTLIATATTGATIPAVIIGLATREVAADLWYRRASRNGQAKFDGPNFTPIRLTRDPMKAAADILAPYVTPGIA